MGQHIFGQGLRPGQLVILGSTTYPGTTYELFLPMLEETGLKVGKDFFLSYSPERIDPGNKQFPISKVAKVVGGITPKCANLAQILFEQIVKEVFTVKSTQSAEMVKLLENTFRAINIGLANEVAIMCDKLGIDVWEVIDAAATKPYGFMKFQPGPGLGGHCIPIDPFYLSWVARKHGMPTRFIELAGEINTSMPQYVVHRLIEALNATGKPLKGSKVCVLGVAYKKDVDDPRESPSFVLMDLLSAGGAVLSYNDPHVPTLPRMRHHDTPEMNSTALTPEFLAEQDCVLIATDHSAYDYESIVQHARLVVDTRNATKNVAAGREKIWKA